MEKILIVDEDGAIIGVHDDDMPLVGGVRETKRSASVEPLPDGHWEITLADIPELGAWKKKKLKKKFDTRKEALEVELLLVQKILVAVEGS